MTSQMNAMSVSKLGFDKLWVMNLFQLNEFFIFINIMLLDIFINDFFLLLGP